MASHRGFRKLGVSVGVLASVLSLAAAYFGERWDEEHAGTQVGVMASVLSLAVAHFGEHWNEEHTGTQVKTFK